MDVNSEINRTQQSENLDSTEVTSATASADAGTSHLQEDLQKIAQYRQAAQQSPNPDVAVLAGANSNLLETLAKVADVLRRSLPEKGAKAEEVEANAGAIELLIRLAKPIPQFEKLKQQIASGTGCKDPFKLPMNS